MKKLCLLLGLSTILLSCERDINEESSIESLDQAKGIILSDDTFIPAGYGYDVLEDRATRNPIDPDDIFRNTNVPPRTIDVEIVERFEDIDDVFKRTDVINFSIGTGELFNPGLQPDGTINSPEEEAAEEEADAAAGSTGTTGTTGTTGAMGNPDTEKTTTETANPARLLNTVFNISFARKRDVEETLRFDSRSINFVVRVRIPKRRYVVPGDPFISGRAEELLEEGDIDRFLRRFGPAYVAEAVYGGELLYMFNYNFDNTNNFNKDNLQRALSISISNFFGLSVSGSVTDEETEIIRNAKVTARIVSTVPNYAPGFITIDSTTTAASILNDIETEINSFTTHMDALDVKDMAVISQTLTPHEDQIFDIIQIREAYLNSLRTYYSGGVQPLPVDGSGGNTGGDNTDTTPADEVVLNKGGLLNAPSGYTRLENNGTLVTYNNDNEFTWFNTGNNTGEQLIFQGSTGNLVLNDANGNAVWSSNTNVPGSSWAVDDRGGLEVRGPNNELLWAALGATGTKNGNQVFMRKGDVFTAGNGYQLTIRQDGVFVLLDNSGQIIWFASGPNTAEALMQRADGSSVLLNGNNQVIWSTNRTASGGAYWLFNSSNGDLEIRRHSNNSLLWSIYNRNSL